MRVLKLVKKHKQINENIKNFAFFNWKLNEHFERDTIGVN